MCPLQVGFSPWQPAPPVLVALAPGRENRSVSRRPQARESSPPEPLTERGKGVEPLSGQAGGVSLRLSSAEGRAHS